MVAFSAYQVECGHCGVQLWKSDALTVESATKLVSCVQTVTVSTAIKYYEIRLCSIHGMINLRNPAVEQESLKTLDKIHIFFKYIVLGIVALKLEQKFVNK